MKTRQRLIVTLLMAFLPMLASAYDAKVDGIYYNLDASTKTATVTFKDSNYGSYSKSVTIPPTVTYGGVIYDVKTIGHHAFWLSEELTAVTIPSSVTTIEKYAFGCTALTSITIPGSVKTFGEYIFYFCQELKKAVFNKGVTIIAQQMFERCQKLESVTLPSTLKTIDWYAFYQCSGLESITIPEGVTDIKSYAFDSCDNLRSITFPSTMENVGWYSFAFCDALTSVIVKGNTTINNQAFYSCSDIRVVSLNCTTIDNWFAGTPLETVTLGNNVQTIGEGAFEGCYNLRSLDIGNQVKTISNKAFSGCYNLTYISIPNSVTSIGKEAFYAEGGEFRFFGIGSGVTSVGEKAFGGSPYSLYYDGSNTAILPSLINKGYLLSVSFGSHVTSIPANLFSNCGLLETVTLSDNVTYIGESAFSDCYYLREFIIPKGVTTIYDKTFMNCPQLIGAYIGDNVTTIGDKAFYGCYQLQVVSIGKNVNSIGENAFSDCSQIENVYCYATKIPTIHDSSFDFGRMDHATLYVQPSLLSTYSNREPWSSFGTILPIQSGITTALEELPQDKVQSSKFKVQSDSWFTIDGRKINGKPTKKGVYIHNGKKVMR